MELKARVSFRAGLRAKYSQQLSNIEGIHAILIEHTHGIPERMQDADDWMEKRVAALNEWYQLQLNE